MAGALDHPFQAVKITWSAAPLHLRRELGSGRLHVLDTIARDCIWLYHKLGVVWTRNEAARPAVLVIYFLTWSGIDKERSSHCVPVKLIKP